MEKGSTGDPTNVFTFKRLYTNFHMVNKGLQIIWKNLGCFNVAETLDQGLQKWPCSNATNIVIIDHHEPRVDCNPPLNVIILPSMLQIRRIYIRTKII